jgi:hypothetical protein
MNSTISLLADSTLRGTTGLVAIEGANALPSTTPVFDLILKAVVVIATAGKPLIEIFKTLFSKKNKNTK